ncbi:MAG: hypothetical protein JNM58_08120 [Xanthomonadaceae bacterium]|nr:hypothetical protein [Xanthomonadaceae bacterium]
MNASRPESASPVAWAIAQALICIAGGAWIGQSVAPGEGAFVGGGAFVLFGALLLSYFAGQKAAMIFGLTLLGVRGAQRLRRGRALAPEAGHERDQRDGRRVDHVAAAVAVIVFCLFATLAALLFWIFADGASLFGVVLRAWALVAVVAVLMSRALPGIDDGAGGGTPPP